MIAAFRPPRTPMLRIGYGDMRELTRSVTSRMSLRSSGLQESGHAPSPRVWSGPRACRLFCSSSPRKGRAERQGVSPRPRRPHVLAYGQPARRFRGTRAVAQPNAEDRWAEPGRGSRSSPAFRTRMDFAACCMSQGLSLAPTRPRSCELSPGHALGPSARLAGVCPCPLSQGSAILTASKVRHRSGHPHPAATYRRRSRRAPHRSGMAAMILVP